MISELERIIKMEERFKSYTHRIDELELEIKNTRELITSVKEIATEIKFMREDLADVVNRIKTLEDQPKNKWNTLTAQIISLVVGAVVSFILLKIGLGG